MDNRKYTNEGANLPGEMNGQMQAQPPGQYPYYQTDMMPRMPMNFTNLAIYPEIFYRLQPYVVMVCDHMDTYGSAMPTQEAIEQISDGICDDVCRLHPDMAEYAKSCDKGMEDDPPTKEAINPMFGRRGFGIFGRRSRRRGFLGDLVDILLLQELLRRRRRPY